MSGAYDAEQELADEKRREETSKRKSVPNAYMSKCIFAKAKQVGKPIIFD